MSASAVRQPQTTYKNSSVIVLGVSGNLTQVQYTADDQPFWVQTAKLKTTQPRSNAFADRKKYAHALGLAFTQPLVDHILNTGHFSVELRADAEQAFAADYFAATGSHPMGLVLLDASQKWGVQCRIHFPAPKFAMPPGVDFQRNCNTLTINSKELFWFLVDSGMRLGSDAR